MLTFFFFYPCSSGFIFLTVRLKMSKISKGSILQLISFICPLLPLGEFLVLPQRCPLPFSPLS